MTGRKWLASLELADDASVSHLALWLSRSWAVAGLLLFTATWRLWTPQSVYPQVPLVRAAGLLPTWCEWVALGVLAVSLVGLLCRPRVSMGRCCAIAFAAAVTLLVCVDQHRLQPWTYQLFLLAWIRSTRSARRELGLSQLLLISIYFFSAISKFDYVFLHTLGQQFLSTLLGLVHLSTDTWRPAARIWLAGVFPCGELLVAVGLLLPPTRRTAALAAIVMHVALLLILGPWGLGHHGAVLIWNLFFITQIWILFLNRRLRVPACPAPSESAIEHMTIGPWSRVVTWIMWCAVPLPLLAPWGWLDHWPAWQLYAPRNSRVLLYVDEADASRLPSALQPFLGTSTLDSRRRLDIDRWSLAELSVPIYPQDRFQLGVALAVIQESRLERSAQVLLQSVSSRTSGKRAETSIIGREDLEEAVSRYWLNSIPREHQKRN